MPNYTPRLNLPKPLGSENNTRANFNALIDAIDSAAETPAGAQAKANAAGNTAENNAKAYTDIEVGKRATKTEFNAHTGDDLAHNATPSPFANRIMSRDGNGRAAIVTPTADSHIANKGYVDDAANAAEQAAKDASLPRTGGKLTGGLRMDKLSEGVNKVSHPIYFTYTDETGAEKTGYIRADKGKLYWSGVGSGEIYTTGNLSHPAQTNVDNEFTTGQTVTTGLTVKGAGNTHLWFRDSDETPRALLFYNPILNEIQLRVYGADGTSVDNSITLRRGEIQIGNQSKPVHFVASTLRLNGTDVALQNGNYANLRARGTTKADVGLGNVDNVKQATKSEFDNHVGSGGSAHSLATTSSHGFMSSGDKSKLNGIQAGAINQSTADGRYYTKSQIDTEMNSVKQSVGNGKTAIRDAIIDAGGTAPTGSPDSYTHQDLANAISTVSKYASGSTPSQTTVQIRGINFDVGAFSFFYQTSDDGGVSVMFTSPYRPFVRKTSTTAADPVITPVSGGFDITLDRPAGTDLTWEAWGS